MDDEQLVATFRVTGEPQLLDRLMSRHLARVRSMVFRLVPHDATADDLTQEVFLKAFRNLGAFRGDSRFSTWLYRVAANTARDHLRSEQRSKVERTAAPASEASLSGRPEQVLIRTEMLHAIDQAIGMLSPALRAAIVLTVFEQLTPKQAAEIEGCSVDSMYSRIHAARKQLKQKLGDYLP